MNISELLVILHIFLSLFNIYLLNINNFFNNFFLNFVIFIILLIN